MKSVKIVFFVLLSAISIYPQFQATLVKLGFYNPQVTNGGFIIGYESSKFIDEHFDVGWSIDWYNKNYVDQKLVAEFNENFGGLGTDNELRAKTNLHDFPILFNMNANFPLDNKLTAYVKGSIGFETLIIFYRKFEKTSEDELKAAMDFSYRVGAGVKHELGRRSEVLAEVAYHSSMPSWDYEVTDAASGKKKTFIRSFDMSGFLFRVGVRFYN